MVPDGQYYYFSFQKENVNQKEIPYYIFYNLLKYHFCTVLLSGSNYGVCRLVIKRNSWNYVFHDNTPMKLYSLWMSYFTNVHTDMLAAVQLAFSRLLLVTRKEKRRDGPVWERKKKENRKRENFKYISSVSFVNLRRKKKRFEGQEIRESGRKKVGDKCFRGRRSDKTFRGREVTNRSKDTPCLFRRHVKIYDTRCIVHDPSIPAIYLFL